ncbi:hypothetical protein SNEBB_004788 [Seison nebaliae]|nr:hypothetical protein SNEBB_004788 [Seison nebaliae]
MCDHLSKWNTYMSDKSYVSGYCPSDADVRLFECLNTKPCEELPHLLRWHNHILSFSDIEKEKFVVSNIANVCVLADAKLEAVKTTDDDDDDVDLFGDDDDEEEEDPEEAKKRQEKLDALKNKGKKVVIAKSIIILDVKPWEDTTDMVQLEKGVRNINIDGLVWGSSKLEPLAYGVRFLRITCVVEDDKVGTDILEEKITELEEFVQSVDIFSFQKV